MSSKPDLSSPLSQEEIDDLLTRHPIETVRYWAELAEQGVEDDVEDEPEGSGDPVDPDASVPDPTGDGYDEMTNPLLADELERRGLVKSGNKDELIARLREDDAK